MVLRLSTPFPKDINPPRCPTVSTPRWQGSSESPARRIVILKVLLRSAFQLSVKIIERHLSRFDYEGGICSDSVTRRKNMAARSGSSPVNSYVPPPDSGAVTASAVGL